jgi:iron complex outermembrane receptor protein
VAQTTEADASAAPAEAEAQRGGVEDIVVTATRRETSLQDTPLAITALGKEELERFDTKSARDLMSVVPNLYLQRVTPSPSSQTYGMRGLGQTDSPADPTVAVYIDDTYLPRSFAQLFDIPGIERVEVLRGPQGTLYGRNASAGAIRFVTLEPDNEIDARASVSVGNYDAFETHNYLSGPIVKDKIFASVAGVHKQRDGYTYNAITGEHVNDLDQSAIRGKLRFVPSDRIEFGITADYERDRSDTAHYVPLVTPPGFEFDPRVTYETPDRKTHIDAWGVSGRIIYRPSDDVTIKSITSYRAFDGVLANEFDGLPQVAATFLTVDQSSLTQEFQLSADLPWMKLTTGAFYFHENYYIGTKNALQVLNSYTGGEGRLKSDSYAIYGQADFPLTEQLTVTLGARYTHETRRFNASGYVLNPALDVVSTNFTTSPSSGANSFTPKVGIQYEWTPNLMTYASYSKGFQAGGYSLRATSATVANLAFGPEEVSAYEAGIKADWFDRRLRTNIAVFRNEITGKQVSVFLPEFLVSAVQNAAEAYTKGVELEVTAVPTDRVTLTGTVGYLKARYTNWPNAFGCPAACRSGDGLKLVYAPEWTASVRGEWKVPLPIPGEFSISGEYQYQSTAEGNPANDPDVQAAASHYVNAFARYKIDDNITVSAALRNLTNRTDRIFMFKVPGVAAGQLFNPPRTVLFTLAYNY